MNITHPTRFILRPLKSQTAFGRFVVPDYARYRTNYAVVVAIPTESYKGHLAPNDIVIYDTQGDFREVDDKTLVVKIEDILCKVHKEDIK